MNVTINVELSDDQTWAFAQFLKRAGYSDYRTLAASEQEAWEMQAAGEKMGKAFAEEGIAPR